MEKLMTILKELQPDIDFQRTHHLIDDGILDSFDIVTLIAEIADAYHVHIPAYAITPEHFQSVESIMALIDQCAE